MLLRIGPVLALALLGCGGKAVIDGSPGAGGTGVAQSCPERILPVACRANPPDCPAGQFPAAMPDGTCWTGECLDCVDGCQRNDDCMVVEACGCSYHEGCSWAQSRFRAPLSLCIRQSGEICTVECAPDVCEHLECPWCNADGAECVAGTCQAVIAHMCE